VKKRTFYPCISVCKKHFAFQLLFLMSISSAFGQQKWKQDPWKSNFFDQNRFATVQKINQGNLHIVAAMVEFQPDTNRFTSGNGTFNPTYLDTSIVVIDPLPHNQGYFEAHLSFVKHYFETASKNQLSVSFEVLPTVYRLDEEMAYYSPTGETSENDFKLGWFLRDSWEKVNQDPNVQTTSWTNETLFLVFHAGAGRDFDFLNTTLHRTPQDIPSLYVDINGIRTLMQDPAFDGFDVKGFTIRNTGILPETESRTGEFLEEPFILQLAINGLVTAIAGNHIGLPDLFNTTNGNSGIGRFGLMDPEGFFAFFGLFPPLPSAWERLYMGWDTPQMLSPTAESTLNLTAVSLQPAQGMVQYPITSTEYFLIENRHRDAQNAGVTLTIRQPDGNVINQTFTNDDTRFTAENLDSLITIFPKGVLTATSNYEFALPGGRDPGRDGDYFTNDDRLLNGGILIWHIDENIINQGLSNNRINANVYRKGVDLEEADGAQDIGNSTDNIFLESVIGGTAFDMWWSGNNYTVITENGDSLRQYKNRFAPDTRPSTASNSGTFVPVEFYNFSDNQPVASVSVRPFAGTLKPDARFWGRNTTHEVTQQQEKAAYPLQAQFFTVNVDTFLIVSSTEGLTAFHSNPGSTYAQTVLVNRVYRQPIQFQNQLIVVTGSQEIQSFSFDTQTGWRTNWTTDVQTEIIGSISITNQKIDIERTQAYINPSTGLLETDFQKPLVASALVQGKQAFLYDSGLEFDGISYAVPPQIYGSNRVLLTLIQQGSRVFPVIQTDDAFYVFENEEVIQQTANGYLLSVMAQENQSEPIFLQANPLTRSLDGTFLLGASADYLPITDRYFSFLQTPLVLDWDGDNQIDILTLRADSSYYQVMGYTKNASQLANFPLLAGALHVKESLQPVIQHNRFIAVTPDGTLSVWELPESAQEVRVPSPYGSRTDGKIILEVQTSADIEDGTSLLLNNETYNWPNPAGENTHLRWQTTEEAVIQMDIFSLSGRKIWSKTLQSSGRAPDEVVLNTNRWGSGVYFVRVQASNAQKSAHKTYKMVIER
jgi:hypothetical protein